MLKLSSLGVPDAEAPQQGRMTRLFHWEDGSSGSMQMEQMLPSSLDFGICLDFFLDLDFVADGFGRMVMFLSMFSNVGILE
jgi:hypothetical protein